MKTSTAVALTIADTIIFGATLWAAIREETEIALILSVAFILCAVGTLVVGQK